MTYYKAGTIIEIYSMGLEFVLLATSISETE